MTKPMHNMLTRLVVAGTLLAATEPGRAQNPAITVSRTNYHGWPGSLRISNGKVEVIVVPAIGRVQQFGFAGEAGVFWENRALDGDPATWDQGWINFGGDKTWPSPEAEWGRFTGKKEWQPPPAFDGMAHEAKIQPNGDVLLISPVDRFFGLRVTRRVRLDPLKPILTVATSYERTGDKSIEVGIWVITQFKEPVGVFAPIPKEAGMAGGYVLLGKETPPSLQIENGLLRLTRHPKQPFKIGTEAGSLLWVGKDCACRIDSPRLPGAVYPDQSSSAEIYTNPDPLPYVELEMLGPLHTMKAGDKIQRTNVYTLFRRTETAPEAEARKLLSK